MTIRNELLNICLMQDSLSQILMLTTL